MRVQLYLNCFCSLYLNFHSKAGQIIHKYMKNILFSLKHMILLCNVFALNIIGLILSQLGITEQMKHCKRKRYSSKLEFIQFPGVAGTQDNIFLWQVVAQLVSKLLGKDHRETEFAIVSVQFGLHMLCSHQSLQEAKLGKNHRSAVLVWSWLFSGLHGSQSVGPHL